MEGNRVRLFTIFILLFSLSSCASFSNSYESASPQAIAQFKKVRIPLKDDTRFTIVQGAFGRISHSRPGEGYSWDFEVPIGTPVVAAQSGKVIGIWEPNDGNGCNSKYLHLGHYIRILHADGTIAQYVHINSQVEVGDIVEKGQIIAVTAKNGWICAPHWHLHFGIYRSTREINAPDNKTIPVYFESIEGGLLKARQRYKAPNYKI